jgi:hypothetical protein
MRECLLERMCDFHLGPAGSCASLPAFGWPDSGASRADVNFLPLCGDYSALGPR